MAKTDEEEYLDSLLKSMSMDESDNTTKKVNDTDIKNSSEELDNFDTLSLDENNNNKEKSKETGSTEDNKPEQEDLDSRVLNEMLLNDSKSIPDEAHTEDDNIDKADDNVNETGKDFSKDNTDETSVEDMLKTVQNNSYEQNNDELSDVSEIKKIVTDTKNEIRKLGDVNVNAIEDYKEVAERYEFLKNQHDDLVSARDKLITVIEELDKNMREQFTTKFEEIKIEFDKVFRQLFGGGKGTIELDPEADILDAAITIISQPPGKKLQNMMQLSGGEKALTAICLLFAIQNLKPSPFCLLDEIEAALDDSNVDRYAKYLHKLTKNTQFIVITHRRGTMAAADRLYGITMQEKGVSTLVSVDLIENQLDDNTNKN